MELRTHVDIPAYDFRITYNDQSFFIGSCFTDHIGSRFNNYAFPAIINPFGTIYNPVSVFNSLQMIIHKKSFTQDDLYHYNGLWFSFFHNTNFSHEDKNVCLAKINQAITDAHDFLKKTDYLFITLGTAYVYERKIDKRIVSNCHKLPPDHFNRYLLKPGDVFNTLKELCILIKGFNPGIQTIFTVSPIRHIKDGASGNMISKSVLAVAAHQLIADTNNVYYFPAYEIMMDELRDYRFYNPDMIHLNIVAIEYIWEKFMGAFFDNDTKQAVEEIRKLFKAKMHKPVRNFSEGHKTFLKNALEKAFALENKYPGINLDDFKKYFRDKLDDF